jgi:predicted nucleic acid-binding protein
LALRRDADSAAAEVEALRVALDGADSVVTTGLVLQELLQGFAGAKDKPKVIAAFAALPILQPDREDHIAAAELRNACRRAGVQVGTIDALIAQLCIRHSLTLLSTDKDFIFAAKYTKLRLWSGSSGA